MLLLEHFEDCCLSTVDVALDVEVKALIKRLRVEHKKIFVTNDSCVVDQNINLTILLVHITNHLFVFNMIQMLMACVFFLFPSFHIQRYGKYRL